MYRLRHEKNPLSCKARAEPRPGIQPRELCVQPQDKAPSSRGGSLEALVMEDDKSAVAAPLHVEFNHIGASLDGFCDSRAGSFWGNC